MDKLEYIEFKNNYLAKKKKKAISTNKVLKNLRFGVDIYNAGIQQRVNYVKVMNNSYKYSKTKQWIGIETEIS